MKNYLLDFTNTNTNSKTNVFVDDILIAGDISISIFDILVFDISVQFKIKFRENRIGIEI